MEIIEKLLGIVVLVFMFIAIAFVLLDISKSVFKKK